MRRDRDFRCHNFASTEKRWRVNSVASSLRRAHCTHSHNGRRLRLVDFRFRSQQQLIAPFAARTPFGPDLILCIKRIIKNACFPLSYVTPLLAAIRSVVWVRAIAVLWLELGAWIRVAEEEQPQLPLTISACARGAEVYLLGRKWIFEKLKLITISADHLQCLRPIIHFTCLLSASFFYMVFVFVLCANHFTHRYKLWWKSLWKCCCSHKPRADYNRYEVLHFNVRVKVFGSKTWWIRFSRGVIAVEIFSLTLSLALSLPNWLFSLSFPTEREVKLFRNARRKKAITGFNQIPLAC